jgi:hypothetical protein
VYVAFLSSFGIFVSSYALGRLYDRNRFLVAVLGVGMAVVFGVVFLLPDFSMLPAWRLAGGALSAAVLGGSLYAFSELFASETPQQRLIVEEFFRRLDTPVNVAREVFGAGKKQISTFPLVGGTTIVMGLSMSLIFLTGVTSEEGFILGTIITIMIVFGSLMWYFGRKSEIRSAAEYHPDTEGPAVPSPENDG